MTNTDYKINCSDYFDIVLPEIKIIYDTNKIRKIFEEHGLTVYPNCLNDRMIDVLDGKIQFEAIPKLRLGGLVYGDAVLSLPDDDKAESVIVYCAYGGGRRGAEMFKHFKPRDNLKQYCKANLEKLKDPYLCIQIRNTDLKSDYVSLYEQNKDLIHSYDDIYIATDDEKTIGFFKNKGLNALNFTTFPDNQGAVNLHYSDIDGDTKIKNLMSDIYLIMMADEFLSNSKGCFILLARQCRKQSIFKQNFQ